MNTRSSQNGQSKIYEMITDRIIDQLEKGVIPWVKPWACGYHKNYVSKKPYRGINAFLLGCSGYNSPYWLTFKQVQDNKGKIIKGEKGTPVIFWKIYEKKETNNASVDENKVSIPVLRYYTIFNLDQCEGLKVSQEDQREFQPISEAEQIVQNMPYRPRIDHNESKAYYNPTSDFINLPKTGLFFSDEEFYSTLFHEMIHSTGHKTRLNRHKEQKDHHFGSKDYSKEELIAEMGSAFLCGYCGIEQKTIKNQSAYIQSWLEVFHSDKKILINAAAKAQKATDYILNNTVNI